MRKQVSKLANFKKILKTKGLDGAIITNPTNIFYLTGFRGMSETERESVLVLTPKATLIAPRLYQNEARKLQSPNLAVEIVVERHLMAELAKDLLIKCRKIGFEANDLRFGEYQFFKKSLKKMAGYPDLVEQMRLVKTAREIAKIEKAQTISQLAFDQIVKTVKVGQTEEEIAEKLTKIIKSLGGQGLAFESIIASGPNSGMPHHKTGARCLAAGDTLLLDFGAKYENYMGDLSRTVFIKYAKDEQKNIYSHVKNAQAHAISQIRQGTKSSEAYHLASDLFKKNKFEKYFLHGLGHGIGLEIHEPPYLRPSTKDELSEFMVFSVEPGLYFPWGGVRIEDLVVIKNSKAKLLGRESGGLIEIS